MIGLNSLLGQVEMLPGRWYLNPARQWLGIRDTSFGARTILVLYINLFNQPTNVARGSSLEELR